MKKLTYSKAIREAAIEEMNRDDKVFLMGEDVGVMGNTFGCFIGLRDMFGARRVIDTPISEEGFTSMCVAAAMRGLRPVAELMYNDFITVCGDPIFNQAAKTRYMTGGQVKVPMVLRLPMGSGRRNAGHHSQSLEALFCHFPGLKVVAPGCPADAKGLLKAAIRDDDPVMIMEHKLLYAKKGDVPEDEDYIVPLGKANVTREGTDITVITWSREARFAEEAADKLAADGISTEVLDLRSLVPLDWDAIVKSVSKTHNVVIVSEETKRGSYAGEISAQINEDLYDELDAPVLRVCAPNIVSPFSPVLEDLNFAQPDDIVQAVKKVLNK